MNFFYAGKKATQQQVEGYSIALLHSAGCTVCPLKKEWCELRHPDMKAHGTTKPVVYMLGEAPGEEEDDKGRPFVGKAGKILRFRIPDGWDDRYLRWNNVVRTRPPGNRNPTRVEMECCRPSIVRDIEQTKPKAIFGFGNVPLQWLGLSPAKISLWRRRRIPVTIGSHVCWYYPFHHPSYIARRRRYTPNHAYQYPSDDEFAFAKDLERAFGEVESIPDAVVHTRERATSGLRTITDAREAVAFIRSLRSLTRDDVVGFDYETDRLRPYNKGSRVLSCGIALKNESVSFPVRHPRSGWTPREEQLVVDALATFLRTSKCRKVSHHLLFELEWTTVQFGRSQGWEDTESQAYILDERCGHKFKGALTLELLVLQYFGINIKAIDNLDRRNITKAPLPDLLTYNALDAKYHRLLYFVQKKRLLNEGMMGTYRHQMRRIPAAVKTQIKGVPVDQPTVNKFDAHYRKRMALVEREIARLPEARLFGQRYRRAYRPLSLHDVRNMVIGILKIRDIKSVDEKVIGKIAHPIMKLTLRYRRINKLHSTYVKPLKAGSPHIFDDGLLHPVLNMTSTATWRSSSEDPNSQNFPKRKARQVRRQIRHRFMKIVSVDFSGIQARNVAMESRDPALVWAFWHDYDIHADWTERIRKRAPYWTKGFDLTDKSVFKSFRDRSKNEFVFPSFFGAQPSSLAEYLGLEERDAEFLSRQFWEKFPRIKDWHEALFKMYRRYGWVSGLSGFRRRAPISTNQLINSPIQADESKIVLSSMIALSNMGDPRLVANMEIHDDLTFFLERDDVEKCSEIIIAEMLKHRFDWINVPIAVERAIGDDWEHMADGGKYSSDKWYGIKAPSNVAIDGSWSDGTGWANHKGMEKAHARSRTTRR